MLDLDILLQIKNVVKMVNVKGYTETCPLAWYHWTIFFQEFVSAFCELQYADMYSD